MRQPTNLRVAGCALFGQRVALRMPFRYGVASMTAAPHLFVRATVEAGAERWHGVAADNLPPKWFTKDPDTSYAADLRDMLAVVRAAVRHAVDAGAAPTVFELWRRTHAAQAAWAAGTAYPELLWNFGVSLVERAVVDAYCRGTQTTFAAAVRDNTLGIRLGDVHAELAGIEPRQLLPPRPSGSIAVRHTVGLADPLTDAEIPAADRVDDGLPQSLRACVETYGLTHVKIKLAGDRDADLERLRAAVAVLDASVGGTSGAGWRCTLDGNEQFPSVDALADLWRSCRADPALAGLCERVLFVEQPLHRDRALRAEVGRALAGWPDAPPLLIDESGAGPDSLARALALGYAGTSHKNCKGVFHGIANACLVAYRSTGERPGRPGSPGRPGRPGLPGGPGLMVSGEDLTNIGPVALTQDLAVMAALGLTHAERNGHHYFRGVSAFPAGVNEFLLRHHGDLYGRHDGYAATRIAGGRLRLDTVNAAPFGTRYLPDRADFTAADAWDLTAYG